MLFGKKRFKTLKSEVGSQQEGHDDSTIDLCCKKDSFLIKITGVDWGYFLEDKYIDTVYVKNKNQEWMKSLCYLMKRDEKKMLFLIDIKEKNLEKFLSKICRGEKDLKSGYENYCYEFNSTISPKKEVGTTPKKEVGNFILHCPGLLHKKINVTKTIKFYKRELWTKWMYLLEMYDECLDIVEVLKKKSKWEDLICYIPKGKRELVMFEFPNKVESEIGIGYKSVLETLRKDFEKSSRPEWNYEKYTNLNHVVLKLPELICFEDLKEEIVPITTSDDFFGDDFFGGDYFQRTVKKESTEHFELLLPGDLAMRFKSENVFVKWRNALEDNRTISIVKRLKEGKHFFLPNLSFPYGFDSLEKKRSEIGKKGISKITTKIVHSVNVSALRISEMNDLTNENVDWMKKSMLFQFHFTIDYWAYKKQDIIAWMSYVVGMKMGDSLYVHFFSFLKFLQDLYKDESLENFNGNRIKLANDYILFKEENLNKTDDEKSNLLMKETKSHAYKCFFPKHMKSESDKKILCNILVREFSSLHKYKKFNDIRYYVTNKFVNYKQSKGVDSSFEDTCNEKNTLESYDINQMVEKMMKILFNITEKDDFNTKIEEIMKQKKKFFFNVKYFAENVAQEIRLKHKLYFSLERLLVKEKKFRTEGILHLAVTIGNLRLEWFSNSLVKISHIFKPLTTEYYPLLWITVDCIILKGEELIPFLRGICEKVLYWNKRKIYTKTAAATKLKVGEGNCQLFAKEMLYYLFPDMMRDDNFYQKVTRDYIKSMKILKIFRPTKEFNEHYRPILRQLFSRSRVGTDIPILFKTHSELDRFVSHLQKFDEKCISSLKTLEENFYNDFELLCGFDRAFSLELIHRSLKEREFRERKTLNFDDPISLLMSEKLTEDIGRCFPYFKEKNSCCPFIKEDFGSKMSSLKYKTYKFTNTCQKTFQNQKEKKEGEYDVLLVFGKNLKKRETQVYKKMFYSLGLRPQFVYANGRGKKQESLLRIFDSHIKNYKGKLIILDHYNPLPLLESFLSSDKVLSHFMSLTVDKVQRIKYYDSSFICVNPVDQEELRRVLMKIYQFRREIKIPKEILTIEKISLKKKSESALKQRYVKKCESFMKELRKKDKNKFFRLCEERFYPDTKSKRLKIVLGFRFYEELLFQKCEKLYFNVNKRKSTFENPVFEKTNLEKKVEITPVWNVNSQFYGVLKMIITALKIEKKLEIIWNCLCLDWCFHFESNTSRIAFDFLDIVSECIYEELKDEAKRNINNQDDMKKMKRLINYMEKNLEKFSTERTIKCVLTSCYDVDTYLLRKGLATRFVKSNFWLLCEQFEKIVKSNSKFTQKLLTKYHQKSKKWFGKRTSKSISLKKIIERDWSVGDDKKGMENIIKI